MINFNASFCGYMWFWTSGSRDLKLGFKCFGLFYIIYTYSKFPHSYYSRFHSGWCWPRYGQAVRERLLPDHHLQVRGSQPLLQEHVQAQASAPEVAVRRRFYDSQPELSEQSADDTGSHWTAEKEADVDWDQCAGGLGESVPAEPQADIRGDICACW